MGVDVGPGKVLVHQIPVRAVDGSLTAGEGGDVGATAPVAGVDGVDRVEIAVSISEALVPKLAVGDEVDVAISALNANFVGTIKQIERAANMQTKLYNVTISIPE